MDNQVIFKIYDRLPRQGPGNEECTAKAFRMIPNIPKNAVILDIGCGKGEHTLKLAGLCGECTIVALDIHQPYLDELEKKANDKDVSGRVKAVCGSMDALPFDEESFEIIWAESSVFIMGFGKGLNYWKKFLKPRGYMVVTDAVWFTDNPSDEAALHWNEEYPDMKNEMENRRIIESAGYSVISSFRLPEQVWWDSYYDHLEKCLEDLKEEFRGNIEAEQIIRMSEKEMNIFRKYPDEFGITFFIIQKIA